jgi:hypothetical protein
MDDTTIDDGATNTTADDHSLTRRAALAAGAAGAAGIALASPAGAATKFTAARYNKTIIVDAPKEVVFDLDAVQKIQADILGQLGCRACCSGFDFHFPTELQFIVRRFDELGQAVAPQDVIDAMGEVG